MSKVEQFQGTWTPSFCLVSDFKFLTRRAAKAHCRVDVFAWVASRLTTLVLGIDEELTHRASKGTDFRRLIPLCVCQQSLLFALCLQLLGRFPYDPSAPVPVPIDRLKSVAVVRASCPCPAGVLCLQLFESSRALSQEEMVGQWSHEENNGSSPVASGKAFRVVQSSKVLPPLKFVRSSLFDS